MMRNFRTWPRVLWIVFVLSTPLFLVRTFFWKIFECPSCYLFVDVGDGLKNYFTLDYYVKHDSGTHFTGMNYPYGEHIIYTDNQPILALALGWLHRNVIDMSRHVVGTLNMLLILSICLAVYFIYLLLRRWKAGRWWAFGSALFIAFLSPQLWRFHGHYGLGYICFFPLLLLLLDMLVRGGKRKWLLSAGISALIIVMSLSHMYFLLLSAVMMMAYAACWWWHYRGDKIHVRSILPWLIGSVILPGLLLVAWRKATDPVTDRPVDPYGIDSHTIGFETTFFPFIPPLDKAWTSILKRNVPDTERSAYVGMIGLLMLPAFLILVFRKTNPGIPGDRHLKSLAGAGIITWCMGAGLMYSLGHAWLWEALPVLKQFRGLGRFGFPFYYIYTILCSFMLWQLFVRLKEKELRATGVYVLGAASLLWGFEAWLNIKAVSSPVFHPNVYLFHKPDNYVPVLAAAGYKPEDFQAILHLPLVAVGNETMGVTQGFWSLREGIHVATETGLPLVGYAMSRTSISQGLDIIGLIGEPYRPRRRADLFSEKPLLLTCEEHLMSPAEKKWIEKAEKIGDYQTISIYALPSSVFRETAAPAMPRDSLYCHGWYIDFEAFPCDTHMTGKGAIPVINPGQKIWSFTDTAAIERSWNVSFWAYIDNRKASIPVPRIKETSANGQVLRNNGLHRDDILWSESYEDWILVSFPWTTPGHGHTYELYIDNAGSVIDNLLMRHEGDTCVIRTPEMVLYNNLPLPVTQ